MFCPECGEIAFPGPLKAPYMAPEGRSSGSFWSLLLRDGLRKGAAEAPGNHDAEDRKS